VDSQNSKFVFALIIIAVVIGWVYMIFNPSHTIENNLELNSSYYPAITPGNR
jgi:hypothetical protein